MTKELLQDIADSQMVLIGIGKEMEESYQGMKEDTFYGLCLPRRKRKRTVLLSFSIFSAIMCADIRIIV